MNISLVLLTLSGFCYFVAFLLYLISFSTTWGKTKHPAFFLLRLGFFLGTFYFAAEAVEEGFFLPVANLSQALAFLAWAIAFVYLVLLVPVQHESFGLVLAPLLSLFVTGACLTAKAASLPPPQIMMNPYFVIHIISAFFAYASFTLSFAAGVLYLIQYRELKLKHTGRLYHKLLSLEALEKLIYQPILWGLPLLVITVGIGFVWSKAVYGEIWLLDPKTVAILATLGLYSIILYLYYISSFRGKKVALLSLVAFFFLLFTFVGTRFMEGQHNFWQ